MVSSSLLATTYIVPSDREMIQSADEIIIATALGSHAEFTANGSIVTLSDVRVERTLKGKVRSGDVVRICEFGGRVGNSVSYSPGTPAYVAGTRYLIFTEINLDGERSTWGVGLGQFEFRNDVLTRGAGIEGWDAANLEPHVEQARDAAAFIDFIEATIALKAPPLPPSAPLRAGSGRMRGRYDVTAFTRGSYLLSTAGAFFRHKSAAVTFVTARTQPMLNGPQSVDIAIGQWVSAAGGAVHVARGAQDDTALGGQNPDGRNTILFNDSGTFTSGAAGRAFLRCSGSGCIPYSLDGEEFLPMTEVDIAISNILTIQSCLNSVMTHEIGHTLGIRHANKNQATPEGVCAPPLDCADVAVMTATTLCSHDGLLQPWDLRAISTVYGGTRPPVPPARRRAVRR